MRHRAALPAVALTCVLALAACAQQTSEGGSVDSAVSDTAGEPDSGPTTTEASRNEIPDDFPLSAGMAAPEDEIATSRSGTGLRDLDLCGTTPLRGLDVRDRMVADASGGEAVDTRELVLLGSAEEASRLAQTFADLPASCDDPTDGGTDIRTEVRASTFGPAPAATLLQTYGPGGEAAPGTVVIHVVPAGAALLVTSTYGEWSAGALDDGVAGTAESVRRTVTALDEFDDSSPTDTPSSTPSSTATNETGPETGPTEVPADFPLAAGLPEDGGDFDVAAPSADGEGVGKVEMCGQVVWPIDGTAGGTRRLATAALGPEYFDGRELVVHADAEVAGNAMAAIRQAAQDCRAVDNQVWTVLDQDTGYDTVTMGLSYSDGLGSSVFQVTRVGSARLMVQTYGEGSRASLDAQADDVTATTTQLVAGMCVFTRAGC